MAYLNPASLDALLAYVRTNGTRIDICHTEPTTYAQATSTYSLGNKTGVAIGAQVDRSPTGRKVTVPAQTGGTITTTSTSTADDAQFWALTNGSNTLVATGALGSTQFVTSGNTFSLTAFDIGVPGAV